MDKPVKAKFLKRYTDIPAALTILHNRELTLLSADKWDDANDRNTLRYYADRMDYKTVLCACFSQARETYHHWKIFAPGPGGVCIHFFKDELLKAIPKDDFIHRYVSYKSPTQLLSSYGERLDLIPFTKAEAYRDEIEYRIVYASKEPSIMYKTIPIDLSVIRSIVLSPWMAPAVFEATKSTIQLIKGCDDIPIIQSKVIDNKHWINCMKGTL